MAWRVEAQLSCSWLMMCQAQEACGLDAAMVNATSSQHTDVVGTKNKPPMSLGLTGCYSEVECATALRILRTP